MDSNQNQHQRVRQQLDWDDVRAFLAVAETGTLSGAAEKLGVTHSTVARRISELEDAAKGPPLFQRSRLGYRLTAQGRAALRHAQAMLAGAEAFSREVMNAQTMAGHVRVSATPAVVEAIAPHLAALAQQHPLLMIDISNEDRNVSLALGEADIAVRLGRPQSGEALVRKVGAIEYRLFGTKAYLAAHEPRNRQVLGFSDPIARGALPRRIAQLTGDQGSNLALPSFRAQAEAALSGAGAAILPTHLAARIAGLELVTDQDLHWSEEVWLMTHMDARRFANVQAVVLAVEQAFR